MDRNGMKELSFMRRAIKLAKKAEGQTAPNPMVGCVIVKGREIIGEGWHKGVGQPHAEAEALAACQKDPKGAIAFVTLEPCNHTGKNPPCSEALIKAEIAEVFYAIADPNPIASGGGAALRQAGIPAHEGLGREQAEALNSDYLNRYKKQEQNQ